MRYALLIADGAADYPQPELGGKTPLAVANKPAMDYIALHGYAGQAANIPAGLAPGSDIAALSILGYDPRVYYSGRAPLEAAAQKITLSPTETVFRANTVTVRDGIMADFAGGHPKDADVFPLIDYLAENLQIPGVKLYRGVSYRHLCVIDGLTAVAATTPPHDISGQTVAAHLPDDAVLNRIMSRTEELWREKNAPFTQLWLWGGGKTRALPTLADLYHLRGGMISAVDLLRGIATLAGLEIIPVAGATGFYDTNYRGKGEAALEFLRRHDFVVVHVEAPDEAGHNGDAPEKIRAIENFDRFIVKPLLDEVRAGDLRLLVLPDHRTPLNLRTHSAEPVPFALYGANVPPRPIAAFTEAAAANSPVVAGQDLIKLLLA
ncbi:homoserine kinase [Planctomycetales bacterium]|nr:homoserine kinase [Planctomycetales bacterium]GHS99963.1 homoserine kinase [Planctomycetales bacterium]GHV22319.1 homoserine kinase [Planctomycetales bacterium]